MSDFFRRAAHRVTLLAGSWQLFLLSLALLLAWGLSGPLFSFSDTWQLVVNTSTTILTYLLGILILLEANRQSKESKVVHDELIKAIRGARNELINIDQMTEAEVDALEVRLRRRGRPQAPQRRARKNRKGSGVEDAVDTRGGAARAARRRPAEASATTPAGRRPDRPPPDQPFAGLTLEWRSCPLAPMSVTLWLHPANLADCAKGMRIRVRRAVRGHTRRPGSAADIVEAGIDATWNGRSFTASPAHFNTFWVRDMCFSAPALARLGGRHAERLHASLAWALSGWDRRRRHITTTFHAFGHPADVYDYGVDSLPLFLGALRAAGATDLVDRHRAWLEREIHYFVERVVDPATGLVRDDRKYSAHRDTVTNRSNAYGNSMVALLAKTLAETSDGFRLPNPLARHFPDGDWGRLLLEHFWMPARGCYRDAIGGDATTGEANVWPFWTGVEDSPEILAAALGTLQRDGYTAPYPLRYETARRPEKEVWLTRFLLPDYQGSSVWTSLGAMYLSLLARVDAIKADFETGRYRDWIERDGTYWEVLNDAGKCWVGRHRLMIGEESMLWGAIFLDHLRNRAAGPALLS